MQNYFHSVNSLRSFIQVKRDSLDHVLSKVGSKHDGTKIAHLSLKSMNNICHKNNDHNYFKGFWRDHVGGVWENNSRCLHAIPIIVIPTSI